MQHNNETRAGGHPLLWLPRLLALTAMVAAIFFAAGFVARALAWVMNWG